MAVTRLQIALFVAVAAAHAGAFVAFGFIPKAKRQTSVAIALAEAKKKKDEEKDKKKPPPPKKEVDVKPAAKAKTTPAPKPVEAETPPPPTSDNKPPPASGDAPEAMAGFADLGLTMGGGSGGISVPGGGGGGGAGAGGGGKPAASAKPVTKQVKQLAAADPGCTEDVVKPKVETQVQPAYTPEAQQANVEGKVRLEVTIDATGHVTNVKVLSGLGFGLDEAAIKAVKQWKFTAATRCGSAVPTTIKMGVSFGLK